ncbi:stalk domain-containing protein [Paenibacillus macquariensis]|uniref:Copper amine oxidase N-terminal domain-containing protein n=1 Tax=Paenibacillus macquariensis TaxID=948756 RepID=A0ABY1K6V5_9BACL|nr:stalk domain-containing protein [Paenibacillus macquariensis]MEC0092575.1 stalk domain-containing protein [Paenibacillus macquariensis]OAB35523.1 copper amine oxidase [Paenibacillus macquariensis subsp. macquariensis]SIR34315.1 Copper amine oxidase N-terminal domain-containing protein [Paenibacillus macquariensis]
MNRNVQQIQNKVAILKGKKWIVVTLAGLLWIAPIVGEGLSLPGTTKGSVANAASTSVKKLGEEIITSGAILYKYQFSSTRSGKQATALADVIRVDLQNSNVKIDAMNGVGGKFTTRQSTQGMAKENGAVAAVNGDYYITSGPGAQWAPLGGQITNGVLMATPADLKGMYSFTVSKDGKPMIDEYAFNGSVKAQDGSVFPLSGINKTTYSPEGTSSPYSHVNAMYMYTSNWKSLDRPSDSSTTATEILVQNGIISQISYKAPLSISVPEDGYILRAHGTAAEFANTHFVIGQPLNVSSSLLSETTGQQVDPASLQMMIGGHTLLVNGGKASAFTRDVASIGGYRARTALGYSQDGRYAYIVTAEDNSNSSGMSLPELQAFMVNIGVWKAMNLDGGGSTTMVTRPLAENNATLTFNTEYGTTQRSIVNSLGVFSTAPKGQLLGFKISGSDALLIGQESSYSLKGYDTYYNPIDSSQINPTWTSSNGNVKVSGGKIIGVQPGTATITAVSGSAKVSTKVTVLGADELTSLTAANSTAPLTVGTTVSIPVTAVTKSGQSIAIPASSLKWEFVGFKGNVQGDTLTMTSVNANAKVGYAIGRYNGFSTVVVLSEAGNSMWENFENVSYPIQFTSNLNEVKGSATITQGTGDHAKSKVMSLQYDMTQGLGKMYAYAQLNGTVGKEVSAAATTMSVDVQGDKSLNWLRAELTDKSGKTIYVDLAKVIDWEGWKTLNIDLSGLNIQYPAQLKRFYVVNVEEGQDERALTGTVAFDNIQFMIPSLSGDAGLPQAQAVMTIGQKSMTVNGTKKAMDVAPIVQNNSTYVPIRYVVDAFGGSANWDAANQRITVLRGAKLLDLTVNKKEFILNGKRSSAIVAPIVKQSRTLVPLRLVSEQLGLKVTWNQVTKTITIDS